MHAGEQGRMYTANIVDTVIFRSLGKHPNPHLDTLEDVIEEAQTEIWIPELIYKELADHGPDGTTNPYLDHGTGDGWIRVVTLPDPESDLVDGESGHSPTTEAWQEATHFIDQHSKYPTTNNWRDAAVVALAVHLFEQNKRIRVITHTADDCWRKPVPSSLRSSATTRSHHDTTIRLRLRKSNFPPSAVSAGAGSILSACAHPVVEADCLSAYARSETPLCGERLTCSCRSN